MIRTGGGEGGRGGPGRSIEGRKKPVGRIATSVLVLPHLMVGKHRRDRIENCKGNGVLRRSSIHHTVLLPLHCRKAHEGRLQARSVLQTVQRAGCRRKHSTEHCPVLILRQRQRNRRSRDGVLRNRKPIKRLQRQNGDVIRTHILRILERQDGRSINHQRNAHGVCRRRVKALIKVISAARPIIQKIGFLCKHKNHKA